MNNELQQAEILSEAELLAWLKEFPRTLKWDAFVAYDRDRTNRLLMMEYIHRFNSDSYLPPITNTVTIDANDHWEHLYDYLLTQPRLSFEDSTIATSVANLTMHIEGGMQLSVKRPQNGSKYLSALSIVDSLQGPKLTGRISLTDVAGTVGESGKVQINLKDAFQLSLSFADSYDMRQTGGKFFQKLFEDLDDDKKIFVLNELKEVSENDFLDPKKFVIRVFRAPGGNLRSSPNFGQGAVMVFLSGKDGPSGDTPSSESGWKYPVPAGRSSTMLVGNHFLIRKLIDKGLHQVDGEVRVEYENASNPNSSVGKIRVVEGGHRGERWLPNPPGITAPTNISFNFFMASAAGGAEFYAVGKDDRIVFHWSGTTVSAPKEGCVFLSAGATQRSYIDLTWELERGYAFVINEEGRIVIEEDVAFRRTHLSAEATEIHPSHVAEIDNIIHYVSEAAVAAMVEAFEEILRPSGEIDVFRLNSLLFRTNHVVSSQSVHFPMDLALFGDLAPRETTFIVEPQEKTIAPGATHTFKLSDPSITGANWKVEAVEGFEGSLGSITAVGAYTAPTQAQMPGHYTLVLITATTPDYTSTALVKVLKRDVVCNPHMVVVDRLARRIKLSAGALDGGALNWQLKSAEDSRLQPIPPDYPEEFEPGDQLYTSPSGAQPQPEEFLGMDEIIVTNPRTNTSATTYAVVINRTMMALVKIKPGSVTDTQITLELHSAQGVMPGVTWEVFFGGGSISAAGVYTVDKASPHKFVVIWGYREVEWVGRVAGYIVLPVPLMDLEQVGVPLN